MHTGLTNQNFFLFIFRFSEKLKAMEAFTSFAFDDPPLLVIPLSATEGHLVIGQNIESNAY